MEIMSNCCFDVELTRLSSAADSHSTSSCDLHDLAGNDVTAIQSAGGTGNSSFSVSREGGRGNVDVDSCPLTIQQGCRSTVYAVHLNVAKTDIGSSRLAEVFYYAPIKLF